MPVNRIADLNATDIEAPGGTQATHNTGSSSVRGRVAERVDRVSDDLSRRALELELEGGVKSKAAPVLRRASQAADLGAAYVRENDLEAMRSDLENNIRSHPLKSMVIAIGAGWLLARLFD